MKIPLRFLKVPQMKIERFKIYKTQKDLENELINLQTVEFLRKKGGKNFKNKINVLRSLIRFIEPYIIYDQISKEMSDKSKEIMLLNMVYISLQLENLRGNDYLYYKLGEKLFKYFDLNKEYTTYIINLSKDKICNIKKITKGE